MDSIPVIAAALLLRVCLYFGLLSCIYCAAVQAFRSSLWKPLHRTAFGLSFVGLAGYLSFWAWFASPRFGFLLSIVIPLCCAVFAWRRWRHSTTDNQIFLSAFRPWLLILPATLIVLSVGFLFGGTEQPLTTAQTRFFHTLPSDNVLPEIFAAQLEKGRVQHPMAGDWLSSDRPPLETGLTLLLFPYRVASRTLSYMLIGALVQSLWIPALWILLESLSVPPRPRLWVIAACLATGFTLLNTFYIWPKLLAASFGLAFAALIFDDEKPQRLLVPFCAGTLLAFSFLSHGGAAFFIPCVILGYLMRRPRMKPSNLGWVLAGFALCYLPWVAYQKFYDPPGDRLLKMHLAGLLSPDKRPFFRALRDAYSPLTFLQIMRPRVANLQTVFDHQRPYWRSYVELASSESRQRAAQTLRDGQFFFFFPALGFYSIALPLLAAGLFRRYRTGLWRTAALCWLMVLAALLCWCALLFQANAAVVHQGAYAVILLAIAGCVISLWNVSPIVSRAVILAQFMMTLLLYAVLCAGKWQPFQLLNFVAGMLLLIATLRWMTMTQDEPC